MSDGFCTKIKGETIVPAVNVLTKPASSACNMRCAYCFYKDISEHRQHAFEGMLSVEDMEKVMASAVEYADGCCSFAFQGGEPTLAGLDFFQQVVALGKTYIRSGLEIRYTIQTNGYCIDEAWARFFAEHHFLVGLSLDGPAELHDWNRKDYSGKGTHAKVMRAVRLFEKYGVEYNILCVVTGRTARSIRRIYQFYKKQNFRWLQFIPCLEPLGQERGKEAYHLSARDYGTFLVRIFDLWYQELQKGEYVSIRHLNNWLAILLCERPESCDMTGHCSVQFVVEGDGGVYPCDFYVLDEWRLGTVGQQSFAEMAGSDAARRFVEGSLRIPGTCRTCPLFGICRNGCKRNRLVQGGLVDRNYYCEAYRFFFTERRWELQDAARLILRMRYTSNGI